MKPRVFRIGHDLQIRDAVVGLVLVVVVDVLVRLMAWLEHVSQCNVFKLYESVRCQIQQRMPWIWENMALASHIDMSRERVEIPPTLFDEDTDPEAEFAKVIAEMSALAANLLAQEELEEKSVQNIKRVLGGLIRRIEKVFDELKEIEDFFQPAVLEAVCTLANEYDNPKKRKYIAALGSLTCKRDRDKAVVQMPHSYKVPSRSGLEALKEALRTL